MDLDSLIINVFCLIDDSLRRVAPARLRQRGPQPVMADSEVLSIEVVGEYLGIERDTELFAYFRRHYAHFFPSIARVHRTTFSRQAANLWRVKELIWQRLIEQSGCDTTWSMVDSFPLAVCRFARAPRCRSFRGIAGYGKDHSLKAMIYGFRLHVRVAWPGVITRMSVAQAGASDLSVLEELSEHSYGLCMGDRGYWKPELHRELMERGVEMLVPFRKASRDPMPERSRVIAKIRSRIESVFAQLSERFRVKRVWARDIWHLGSRLMRKVLSHTVMVVLNRQLGNEPLRLAELLTN